MKPKSLFFLFLWMILIWGLSFPINKIGLEYTSAIHFIEWRFLVAFMAVLLLTLVSKNLKIPKKKDLPVIAAVGVFQMGFTLILSTYGLSLIDAGKATFIIYTTPIWIILITGILNRIMSFFDLLGFLCGLMGTALLINPLKFRWHDPSSWAGDMALVLAALAWSIGIIATRRLKWHSPPQKLLVWQVLTATLMTLGYGYISGAGLALETVNFILVGSFLYTGILSIALGYWLMVILSKNLSSALVSFGLLWVPIVSFSASCLFLNEEFTPLLGVSVGLILVGILLHIYSEIKTHDRNRDLPS